MKLFVFRDGLFCHIKVIVAETMEQALEFAGESAKYLHDEPDPCPDDPYTGSMIYEIEPGLILEGGGNG